MKLSKRMEAVAEMVTPGYVICDVGTDHGYIPIYLVESGKNPSALAMDLREGPLSRAVENISAHGLSDKIKTRISNGVEKLEKGEAESVVIAGMGGELVLSILKADPEKCRSFKELILQPQSDVDKVRRYLRHNNYRIMDEDMIYEDGKYYPMFRVVPVEENPMWDHLPSGSKKVCDLYGPLLISNGNPVLRKYLVQQHTQLEKIQKELMGQERSEKINARLLEVEQQIERNESAYSIMGEIKHAGI